MANTDQQIQHLDQNVKLTSRMALFFKHCPYYGDGREPNIEALAAIVADIRIYCLASGVSNDKLNKIARKRENATLQRLHDIGMNPEEVLARAEQEKRQKTLSEIEVVPEVSEAEKAEAQSTMQHLEAQRKQRLGRS